MCIKKQRAFALVVCVAFLAILLLSTSFTVEAAGHDCVGEGCPICAAVEQASRVLQSLGSGVTAVNAAILPVLLCFLSAATGCINGIPYVTPVTQKVRMDN